MKNRIRMIAAIAATGLIAGTAQGASLIAPPKERSISFVPSSLVAGQSTRVTLVNLAGTEYPPDPCRVQVTFYKANGEAFGDSQQFDLTPGQSALAVAPLSTDVPPIDAVGDFAPITQMRAVVQEIRPARAFPPDPCRAVQAGYELFETQTQQTLLMNPGVIHGFNPQPDPPG
ncbi:hypothetical protein [Hydrocarboniphaga sp.]|uniref:hypothetical protein n=1 Tax=Hydrocarboniphaga sp. TaxID=2033016 RepID=UPI0026184395|nr:hypothetical protein [Hydrocarboniphaga sp.]